MRTLSARTIVTSPREEAATTRRINARCLAEPLHRQTVCAPKVYLLPRSKLRGYGYAKSGKCRGMASDAERAITGMRWNYYLCTDRRTPLFEREIDNMPAVVSGLMSSMRTKRNRESEVERRRNVTPISSHPGFVDHHNSPAHEHGTREMKSQTQIAVVVAISSHPGFVDHHTSSECEEQNEPRPVQVSTQTSGAVIIPIASHPGFVDHHEESSRANESVEQEQRPVQVSTQTSGAVVISIASHPGFVPPSSDKEHELPAPFEHAVLHFGAVEPPRPHQPLGAHLIQHGENTADALPEPHHAMVRAQHESRREVGYISSARRRIVALKVAQGAALPE